MNIDSICILSVACNFFSSEDREVVSLQIMMSRCCICTLRFAEEYSYFLRDYKNLQAQKHAYKSEKE